MADEEVLRLLSKIPAPKNSLEKIKAKLLCNPKIKMMALNFPTGIGRMCSLSDILEDQVAEKYFLSDKMTKYLTMRMDQK